MIPGEIYKTRDDHPCRIVAQALAPGTSVFRAKVLESDTYLYPVGDTFTFVVQVFEPYNPDLEDDFKSALDVLEKKLI